MWCNGSTPRSHRGNEGSIPFISTHDPCTEQLLVAVSEKSTFCGAVLCVVVPLLTVQCGWVPRRTMRRVRQILHRLLLLWFEDMQNGLNGLYQ